MEWVKCVWSLCICVCGLQLVLKQKHTSVCVYVCTCVCVLMFHTAYMACDGEWPMTHLCFTALSSMLRWSLTVHSSTKHFACNSIHSGAKSADVQPVMLMRACGQVLSSTGRRSKVYNATHTHTHTQTHTHTHTHTGTSHIKVTVNWLHNASHHKRPPLLTVFVCDDGG